MGSQILKRFLHGLHCFHYRLRRWTMVEIRFLTLYLWKEHTILRLPRPLNHKAAAHLDGVIAPISHSFNSLKLTW